VDPAAPLGAQVIGVLRVLVAAIAIAGFAGDAAAERYALIVSGASGGDAYAKKYRELRTSFVTTLRHTFSYDPDHLYVLADEDGEGVVKSTRENVQRALTTLRGRMTRDDQLLVFLMGHGTVDGEEAKFNLVGPDLNASEWSQLLKAVPGRLVFVNTTGASFPFLRKLAGRGRVVLTATDSAAQEFETTFAEYFIRAFDDEAADVDKNGRVSIWEAFVYASAAVRQGFEQKGELPTERSLLDDTGAGIGREAQAPGGDGSMARVTYLEPEPALDLPSDAALATLVKRRAALEYAVEELKARKESMPPDQYDAELERIVTELARVSLQIKAKS
jgi:hypothetical protein